MAPATILSELSLEGELFDALVVLGTGTFDIVNIPTMSFMVWYRMFFTYGDHVMSCEHNTRLCTKLLTHITQYFGKQPATVCWMKKL